MATTALLNKTDGDMKRTLLKILDINASLKTGASVLLAFGLSSFAARAQTFQFQEGVAPTAAYQSGAVEVRQDLPTQNRDGGSGVAVGVQGFSNSVERGLFSFDLSALPDGATLGNVSFTLTINFPDSGSGSTLIPLELHLLTSSFNEATVTWNTQPANTTLLSSLSIAPTSVTNGQTITWNSTPAFLAAAQAAADANGTLNFALRLADANEAAATTRNIFFFDSNDTAAGSTRPLLTVMAVVPEPSASMCLVLGAITLAAEKFLPIFRRREES